MKKKFLILILVFFLTGCTAEYNLKISEEHINEELIINNYDSSTWNTLINDSTYKKKIDANYDMALPILSSTPGIFDNPDKIDGYEYYNQYLINTSNNYGLKYSYNFNFNDYNDSTIPKNSYSNFKVSKSGNIVNISAINNNHLFDSYDLLEKLTINVKVPFAVTYHNADQINENVYTWIIDRNNVSSKSISLSYALEDEELKPSEEERATDYKTIMILASVLILTILTIFIIFKIKFNKNNNI